MTIEDDLAGAHSRIRTLNAESMKHRLAAKADKARADALAAEVEKLKSDLAARPAGESGDPSPAATGVPAPQPPPDPAAAATLGEDGSFVASLARAGVLPELLEEAAATLTEAGVKQITTEDLPPEWLVSSGAPGSGGKPPAPAQVASKPATVDWDRFKRDTAYRQDPKVRAMAEAESAALLRSNR